MNTKFNKGAKFKFPLKNYFMWKTFGCAVLDTVLSPIINLEWGERKIQ